MTKPLAVIVINKSSNPTAQPLFYSNWIPAAAHFSRISSGQMLA